MFRRSTNRRAHPCPVSRLRVGLVATALAVAAATPALAEVRPAEGPARVVAREWGVWKVQRGTVTHLEELAAEVPPFVFRAVGVPEPRWRHPVLPPPPPVYFHPLPRPVPLFPAPPPWVPPPGLHPARKPVVFLYSDRPVDVRVEVAFRGGAPWLHYPDAETTSRAGVGGALVFRGRVVPNARTPLRSVPRGHFWHDLRAAGGDLVLSESATAERFLFYDGPVLFQRSFAVARRGSGYAIARRSTEDTLWLVEDGAYREVRVEGRRRHATVATGDTTALRARLAEVLRARGLSAGEARSLLETWRDDLFLGSSPRAISLVPRDLYDRMLPCTIEPEPAELVRVGVVIDELD